MTDDTDGLNGLDSDDGADLPKAVQRLGRDLADAASTMSDAEARFLVDAYYAMQDARIRSAGQIRSMVKNPVPTGEVHPQTGEPIKRVEPHDILAWLCDQNWVLEVQVKRALAKYVQAHSCGSWLINIYGVGPVISAGLLAHIDIRKAPTAGHIWRFAGLDPSVTWEKKTKRPWNADLKVVCWKAGESFVKFHKDKRCYYGHLWRQRKTVYEERNANGVYAARSAEILAKKNFKKDTDAYAAYSQGKFPPAHIHAMARRYCVKILLAHLHHVMYERVLHEQPPFPYPIKILGHAHYMPPPGLDGPSHEA